MLNTALSQDGQSLLTLAFIFWQHGKHSRALAILEGLHHLEPQSDAPLPLLCAAYIDNALYNEALEIGQRLLDKSQGHEYLNAAYLCAKALWKSDRENQATSLLHQALENFNNGINK